MKPIKIQVTALGPYKEQETIDFTELLDHRLFVVSGNTGAGKTTIFDAICFALYGQASGDDRSEARMLRSHFADDDVHTSVTFRFEQRGTIYEVFRQLPHVKAGNKSETGERNELYEVSGDQLVPLTDRQSKRAVDERLQQIIGLTREQFSQIVMLPQGEFRKLLVSDTDNKEKILRNIFKTNLYKTVETELDSRRRASKQELDERVKVRDVYTSSLLTIVKDREGSKLGEVLAQDHYNVFQVLTSLEEEITESKQETKRQQDILESESARLKQATEQFHQAKALDDRFAERNDRAERLKALEGRIPLFSEKKTECDSAKQAKHLQVYDEHYAELAGERDTLRVSLESAVQGRTSAEAAYREADEAYKREEQKADLREQLIRELDRLNGYRPAVEAMETTKQRLTKLLEEAERLGQILRKTDAEWAAGRAKRDLLVAAIKGLEESVRTFPEKTEQLTSMREQAKRTLEYMKLQESRDELAGQEKKRRLLYEHSNQEYADIERRWVDGQASVLAEHLHDGEPCPVCGSSEHPRKANRGGEVPSKQQLEAARERKREAENAYVQAKARFDHVTIELDTAGAQLAEDQVDTARVREVYGGLVEQGKQLAGVVEQMKADQTKLAETKESLEQVEVQLELLRQQKEKLSKETLEQKAELEKEQALADQAVRSIPEELRSLDMLNRMIRDTEEQKRSMDAAWKEAQTLYQQCNEQLIAATQRAEHLAKQEADTASKLEKAKAGFDQALTAAGFGSQEAYREAKRTNEAIAALEHEIEQFERSLNVVRKQLEESDDYLKDKTRPLIEELGQQLHERERVVEAARTALFGMQQLSGKLMEAKDNLELAEAQVKEAESQYSEIKDLYDTIRGDNRARMSFERYLQVEFLERIIEAANLRLTQMSNGQYVLMRSDRIEKHGKQSGLGFDVFDHYTGQYRDVKTLSGGEKFNASLCLALGMADVIQSYQGGISIETMFIDEGFGSLDEESLGKAIEVLVDLQQTGRMIGVISHVQELKQAIPAVLEVTKTREGYSRTRFLVS